MITTFDTSTTKGSSKGSMNKVIMIIVIGAGLYFGYKYIVKPAMDKRKTNDE